MQPNQFFIPQLNPLWFYQEGKVNLPKYHTKYPEDYPFDQRFNYWDEEVGYSRIWQTDDIIVLQFESTFDPIIVELLNKYDHPVIQLPALVGRVNMYEPGTYSFNVSMSLAGLQSGCYRLQIKLGSGPDQIILKSINQFISSDPIDNSILIEYKHSHFHKDVIFEDGTVFQLRLPGSFGYLDKIRFDEIYRDEKFNSTILGSNSARQYPLSFGDEFGLPDDDIDLLDLVWSCDHVTIDNKLWSIADGSKFEYAEANAAKFARYPMRGVTVKVEEGINRNSYVFGVNTDPTKKLVTSAFVEAKVFGDLSRQGSNNVIPVINVITE